MIGRVAVRRLPLRKCRPLRAYSTEVTPTPSSYPRPVEPGVIPAYDEALKIIGRYLDSKRAELETLRNRVVPGDKDPALARQIEELEIETEIHDPEVRWRFKNGLVDMSQTIYRHMTEQKWRNEGVLDRVMERIYQMKIVPDLLPSIRPSVDLELRFPAVEGGDVEPGIFLLPKQTVEPPEVSATVFHPEERLYTLLLVDPDVPDVEAHTFTTFLHWLVPNIPITPLTPHPALPPALVSYIPPHPQHGTPYHRYATFLLPQRSPSPIPIMKAPKRFGFSLREFVKKYHLQGDEKQGSTDVNGGGVHMFREVWNEDVGAIHEQYLGIKQPMYGRPKEVDPYLNEEGVKPRKYY